MKLKLPDGNKEETSDEIKVKVWTERTKTWLEPPILVQKHELTRWNGQFEFEDGELGDDLLIQCFKIAGSSKTFQLLCHLLNAILSSLLLQLHEHRLKRV